MAKLEFFVQRGWRQWESIPAAEYERLLDFIDDAPYAAEQMGLRVAERHVQPPLIQSLMEPPAIPPFDDVPPAAE